MLQNNYELYDIDELFEKNKKDVKLGYDLIGNSVCVPVIKAVA